MSKRSPASKHARTPKIPAKAQRAKREVVTSPKSIAQRLVEAAPAESPSTAHDTSKPAAPVVETAAAALQDARTAAMTNNAANRGFFDFSYGPAHLQAYQAKFLDMALANMQFAFDFAQRLAAIRSPLDILGVTAEFTGKRIALLQKYA
jgi:hypothetical protein